MTLASLQEPVELRFQGAVDLVSTHTIAQELERAERDGYVAVRIPPPTPARRGRLALAIEEAVEDVLMRRGAAPPGVGAASRLDATLGDQLYRARLLGAPGMALGFPTLEGIANLAGVLDAEDSAVLRWWIAVARERPLRLYFNEGDRRLGIYGPPVDLATFLQGSLPVRLGRVESVPAPAPAMAASAAAMGLSPRPPEVAATTPALLPASAPPGTDSPALTPSPKAGLRPIPELDLQLEELCAPHAARPQGPPAIRPLIPPRARREDPEATAAPNPTEPAASTATSATASAAEVPDAGAATATDPTTSVPGDAAAASEPAADGSLPDGDAPIPAPISAPALLAGDAVTRWPGWVAELDAARGPKPLAVVERMFVSAYVPLRDAISLGVAGRGARDVADGWATSFAKSYGEAFDALRLRNRRPSMVLDAPELAQRLARLHGARSVQLILVDGMRFDLGLRMHDRLQKSLERGAALTERLLLWSALPTTTDAQLDLLGRGASALQDSRHAPESTLPVARGRAAATPRRIRAGHRELLKLDLVAARLANRSPLDPKDLETLATELAESLTHCLRRLPPRTLAFVFGDHGFALDATAVPSEGGTSPEEVLVPAFAWLVGDVH